MRLRRLSLIAAVLRRRPRRGRARPDGRRRLALGRPAALGAGLSMGAGAGFTGGGWLTWGARAAWGRATEFNTLHTVTHDDVRLRAVGALQARRGLGTMALRLGLGGTWVHESRVRDQASRAGLSGADAEQTSSQLSGGDLEAVATLRLWRDFGLMVAGGPSVHVHDGDARLGFVAGVSAAWQP